jgi:hypothetical protein
MGLLVSRRQFFDDLGVDGSLRFHEANEIRSGHEGTLGFMVTRIVALLSVCTTCSGAPFHRVPP